MSDDISSKMIPEGTTDNVPAMTKDPSTGYGFYDSGEHDEREKGQIADANTAQEIANTAILKEQELLQQHKESASETEKLTGGYLEVIKPLVQKYPDLFAIKEDSEGRIAVISKLTEPENKTAINSLVFWKDKIAQILSESSFREDLKNNLNSISPEHLTNWKQIFDLSRKSIIGLNPDLSATVSNSKYRMQSINGVPDIIRDTLQVLIEQRNAKIEKNIDVQPLKEAVKNL